MRSAKQTVPLLRAKSVLGKVLLKSGSFPEAERVLREAIDAARRMGPVDDSITAEITSRLGEIYLAMGDFSKAEVSLRDADAALGRCPMGLTSLRDSNRVALTKLYDAMRAPGPVRDDDQKAQYGRTDRARLHAAAPPASAPAD
jgi:hypothetical protein